MIHQKQIALFIGFIIFGLTTVVWADPMSSSNYKIQADSVNIGGLFSTSTNYSEESTIGETATGMGTSTSYNLYAGYQQLEESSISLSPASHVIMSPSLGGVTGGISNGATSFVVTTDNPAGYEVTLHASSSPALVSGSDSFADYTPSGSDPDFSFSIPSNESAFGFSPEGDDIATRFKDSGGVCNQNGGDTVGSCWDGLSTTPLTIVQSGAATSPSGTLTTIKFRAEVGSGHVQAPGVYTATTTITVTAI